jgi:hypothetical protein
MSNYIVKEYQRIVKRIINEPARVYNILSFDYNIYSLWRYTVMLVTLDQTNERYDYGNYLRWPGNLRENRCAESSCNMPTSIRIITSDQVYDSMILPLPEHQYMITTKADGRVDVVLRLNNNVWCKFVVEAR